MVCLDCGSQYCSSDDDEDVQHLDNENLMFSIFLALFWSVTAPEGNIRRLTVVAQCSTMFLDSLLTCLLRVNQNNRSNELKGTKTLPKAEGKMSYFFLSEQETPFISSNLLLIINFISVTSLTVYKFVKLQSDKFLMSEIET